MQKKKNSICPKCGKGVLMWLESGEIKCPDCDFITTSKTRKIKRNFEFEVIGLTIIDSKTQDIEIKELKIRSNKKKRRL